MVLTKYTGIQTLTGSEAEIFNVNKGPTTIHFGGTVYLDELVSGDTVRVRVYDKKDGVGYWKFDGEVNDYVSTNNGTITYNANLKALYKFEQNINDSTTGSHNLTLAAGSIAYSSGMEGSAILFDGSTYYTASSSVIVTGTNDRTVSFWIYTPSTFVSNTYYLFDWGAGSTSAMFGVTWNDTGNTSRLLFAGFGNDVVSTNYLQANTWYHLVFTLSSTGTVRKIYINGTLDSSNTTTALNTSSSSLYIGSIIGGGDIIESGVLIDEFRIYSVAISQAQVSSLYMVGKYGQSHTFDGGEYISVGNPTALQFERTNSFTFAYWAKYTSNTKEKIITKNNGDATKGYEMGFNASGFPILRLINTSSTNEINVVGSASYDDGNYHHFVWTYSGTSLASGVILYVDNAAVTLTTTTNNLSATITNSNNVIFGADTGGTNPLIAQIDDLRIYNRVLSSSEVSDLYNNPQNLNSIVYDKSYSGPLSSKTLYIPIIQTNNYSVTLQQSAGNYYKTLDWSRIEIT